MEVRLIKYNVYVYNKPDSFIGVCVTRLISAWPRSATPRKGILVSAFARRRAMDYPVSLSVFLAAYLGTSPVQRLSFHFGNEPSCSHRFPQTQREALPGTVSGSEEEPLIAYQRRFKEEEKIELYTKFPCILFGIYNNMKRHSL